MNSGKIFATELNHVPVLKFEGDVRVLMSSALDHYLTSLYSHDKLDAMLVDLSDANGMDSTTLGILAKMSINLKRQYNIKPTIISTNPNITKILQSMNFEGISVIVNKPLTDEAQFGELPEIEESAEVVRKRVIEAHKALMNLSDENRLQFQDLVSALEKEV